MSVITTRRNGDVLLVMSDNPPVNALGFAVRSGLVSALDEAAADDAVKAVVIIAQGRTFFAGADITEFGQPIREPELGAVCDAIEGSAKPVIAAIHGTALGGGLEVALACHYRIAVPGARLGLPEVKLGLLPGAGGTQRLPRVVGVAEALPIILFGDPVSAGKALAIGLIDRLAGEASLEEDAVSLARAAIGKPLPVSRARRDRIDSGDVALVAPFQEVHARRFKNFEAPAACAKAIEAAVELPFEQGVALERALFMQLLSGTQSAAMRHLFFAERAAARIDDIPASTPLLPVAKIGILGAGTMGGGIAMNFLSAGIPVTLVEREQAALDRGVAIIRGNYEATARKGRMSAAQVEAAMALLTPSLRMEELADSDLVIEAVFELMAVKKEVFAKLDAIVKPGAILATNTSFLDVDEIASATTRPQDVIGLHFFSPANVMKLLEVVRGGKTAPSVLATAMALAKRIGKIAVVSGVCHGFIGNRMLEPRQAQADALVLEGAKPADVDQVLLDFGFPMGPFQMLDLAGLDLGWEAEKSAGRSVQEILCERGRRGQKTGKGYYDYDEKRQRAPSAEVERIITDFAASRNIPQRQIDRQEILERLLYPMINEGALILEEGMAQRASDIDTVWLNGYGWPAYTGGPMFWAGTVGLDAVVAGLRRHADRIGGLRLSSLLVDKADKGEAF
ncbi:MULTISPECIES: 3-hydroxyacyl-CoA dehydrogenase NAD-binding domain-containing protein [Sphingobium]|uniref:3-hydroxyacyl-CoA dehydrogenase NAD-binding domain-containing protein n=1 Tax=Sphingobium TaxID=165695 RepID=UPI00159C16E7|nr:3-hydroxyacyl-CoA dehydrogenase NAD-binding domain-containing protein [Sphingobium sp. 15-1]